MRKIIDSFQGEYRFLSNFWFCSVTLDGEVYRSVEHAYQAAKTLDKQKRKEIAQLEKSGEAKRAGKYLALREDWEEVKFDIMRDLLQQKFAKGTALRKKLDATGDARLVEGNTWGDQIWGCVKQNGEWVGKNYLGKMLMRIRDGE